MTDKPHKGSIAHWRRIEGGALPGALDYFIRGRFVDHPDFAGEWGCTSNVVTHEGSEIETRNSRYTLIGEESHAHTW